MTQSIFAWLRFGAPEDPPVAIDSNFSPIPRQGYRIGLPIAGTWHEIFNSDAREYGGSGLGNLGKVTGAPGPSHGFPAAADILVPPLATVMLQLEPD